MLTDQIPKKKRIALTGATGYLGSILKKKLLQENYRVLEILHKGTELKIIDDKTVRVGLDNKEAVISELLSCSAIIHTGTCYGRNGETIEEMIDANVERPLRLVDDAIKAGVKSFVNIGSCLPENLTPYSLTKKHFWDWAEMACRDAVVSCTNIKLENFYGEMGSTNNFITKIIRECIHSSEPIKLTEGTQKRDFVHIDDVVDGILLIFEKGLSVGGSSCEYEIGTGQSTSVRHMVEMVASKLGAKDRLDFGAIPCRINEPTEITVDLTNLKSLGWYAKIDLEKGIQQVVDYEMGVT